MNARWFYNTRKNSKKMETKCNEYGMKPKKKLKNKKKREEHLMRACNK